eukprot:1357938-Rhodomonas_salina.1
MSCERRHTLPLSLSRSRFWGPRLEFLSAPAPTLREVGAGRCRDSTSAATVGGNLDSQRAQAAVLMTTTRRKCGRGRECLKPTHVPPPWERFGSVRKA